MTFPYESVSAMMLNFNDFNTIISLHSGSAVVVVGVFEPWWPLGSLQCLLVSCELDRA